jgi:hypothetical protein
MARQVKTIRKAYLTEKTREEEREKPRYEKDDIYRSA